MDLLDTLKASAVASLWFSWIAALVACVPILLAFAIASPARRPHYLTAGIIGALAGEASGVTSLFLSLWIYCRGVSHCNTAQGDMGLIVTLPIGTLVGCFIALFWTRAIRGLLDSSSGSDAVSLTISLRRWTYVAVIPAVFWLSATLLAARLMA